MRKNRQTEQMQQWLEELGPAAINNIQDLLSDPETPVNARVTLIGMILDRVLGKAETPLRVTAEAEGLEEAEAKLAALVADMTRGLGEGGKT